MSANNPAVMVMMPVAQKDGSLTYFWVVETENEINVGWCENGTEISKVYDEFKKRAGGYLRSITEQIIEVGEHSKMDIEN